MAWSVDYIENLDKFAKQHDTLRPINASEYTTYLKTDALVSGGFNPGPITPPPISTKMEISGNFKVLDASDAEDDLDSKVKVSLTCGDGSVQAVIDGDEMSITVTVQVAGSTAVSFTEVVIWEAGDIIPYEIVFFLNNGRWYARAYSSFVPGLDTGIVDVNRSNIDRIGSNPVAITGYNANVDNHGLGLDDLADGL